MAAAHACRGGPRWGVSEIQLAGALHQLLVIRPPTSLAFGVSAVLVAVLAAVLASPGRAAPADPMRDAPDYDGAGTPESAPDPWLPWIAGGAIPFTEDPGLGGERMPGFVPGWLIGPSGAAARLGYSWPLWPGLDAQARVAVGNAFADHLAGLAPDKLRLSSDLGPSTRTERDAGFELLLGPGTETFEQGAAVTSVRVLLGSKRGI